MVVIALLGLLAFLGTVFFTFASQERAAAEYFSEAAKSTTHHPGGVWPHMLEQILVGPSARQRGSILYSPSRRYSLIRNLFGNDLNPHNGESVDVKYDANTGRPVVGNFPGNELLDFVDSPAARGPDFNRETPEPDVDYTYPDINNLFLAHKGWAIREDSDGRLTQVPVILPSFFRPQYMREPASSVAGKLNTGFQRTFGAQTASVPTNPHWAYGFLPSSEMDQPPTAVAPDSNNRSSVMFSSRSFRPHPSHIAGVRPDGTVVPRYVTDDEAIRLGVAGGFPFLPSEGNSSSPGSGNGIRGDLGIWTGSADLAYELDADNDGDGITEGIWLDLGFPIQEHQESGGEIRTYAVLHSVTIYDLDGLFNLNVHGNLAGLPRTETTPSGSVIPMTVAQAVGNGHLSRNFLSRSHHGLGPSEVNPIHGLRRTARSPGPFDRSLSDQSVAHYFGHFGSWPTNALQQANMDWMWLLTGRGEFDRYSVARSTSTQQITSVEVGDLENILDGRWGESQLLYSALQRSPGHNVADLPRPGRSGNVYAAATDRVSFGGRSGFDDNRNWREGEGIENDGTVYSRPYGHPVSFSGLGRRTQVDTPVYDPVNGHFSFLQGREYFESDSPLFPILVRSPGQTDQQQFAAYLHYSTASEASSMSRYVDGIDGAFTGSHAGFQGTAGDDLLHDPMIDDLFEDPMETIFDPDRADRSHDSIASIGDLVALQWPPDAQASVQLEDAQDSISMRLPHLAPHSLALSASNRQMFTTHSNTLRHFPLRPSPMRPWEFSADSDGADRNNDGFGDGDGRLEFPPAFGTTSTTGLPFSRTDPFRPALRRLLTKEAGEKQNATGLPLSLNHIVDVERFSAVPAEGTTAYLRYMQRAGLRFRSLTEHPLGTDDSSAGESVLDTQSVYTLEIRSDGDSRTVSRAADVPFPTRTVSQQEFWARRDRQQLARDIFVLLYTTGGAEQDGNATRDYTANNDPDAPAGTRLYSHDQLRRMAQFAVNAVDAMDTDSVITKFEYDKNLGNGWNLDDDPFSAETERLPVGEPMTAARRKFDSTTNRGMYPEDAHFRGVVYGVEAQHLTFNEVLSVRCGKTEEDDHLATLHDDTEDERDHLLIELKNVRPQSLSLGSSRSTTPETAIYRIVRFDRPDQFAPLGNPENPNAGICFLKGAGQIRGGDIFTVSTASDSAVVSSDLYVDWNLDDTYDLISPNVSTTVLPTTGTEIKDASALALKPHTDLDLIHPDHANDRFVVTGSSQTTFARPGAFLDDLTIYQGNQPMKDLSTQVLEAGGDFTGKWSDVGFDLVLQRRLNPNMPSLTSGSGQPTPVNPWVEIDRVRVEFETLDLRDADGVGELTGPEGHLAKLRSFERREPLNDATRQRFTMPNAISDYRFNSIGSEFNRSCLRAPEHPRDETKTSSAYNPLELSELWQPHFDRDFTSPAELLNVPLFGPRLLTQRLDFSRLSPAQQTIRGATDHQVSNASAMFLRSEFDPLVSGDTHRDNRWYRLLQFVEVPSRVHRMLGNYLHGTTIPGKINLNTIRHQEVLAGLIDDPMFADRSGNRLESPFLTDITPGATGRDRWTEFVRERDGIPVSGYFDPTPDQPGSGDEATRFLIPGTPGSRPFRSYAFTPDDTVGNGLDHTILRRLAEDRDEDSDGHDDELEAGRVLDDDDGDLLPDDSLSGGGDTTNRQWLEVGGSVSHTSPPRPTTPVERHQILSKIMNNTTTVSNVFIVFATAAYFEAHEDSETGLYRIGGRIDLSNDDEHNPGWQQRAVFVIDRTEALEAYDPGSRKFNWRSLIKHQAEIE